ncbi:U3 snoRNP protein [Mycoblastus sanguinarius]|nr:U3 snoRNP protein [Mycoblastus sanguinarius]
MAGASDKARFYLEASVPELQELERKKIFTKAEITSIAKKRSDFEHKINARGSRPSDYARYVEYETNLDSLRRKRVKRLGVKYGRHAGQRRIFFILDRATKKFQGDIGLWMQYITFARKQKSNKKVSQILTSMLRLHPTKPNLWIYAANYAVEERGDMAEARSYMQRGLRFCTRDTRMWVEYARLEMIYIAKIVGRRRILGLDDDQAMKETAQEGGIDGDEVALPAIAADDVNPETPAREGVDQAALEKLGATPTLSGVIPMAIFDAAVKEFKGDGKVCEEFFDMVAEFPEVPCTRQILSHLLDSLKAMAPESPATLIRFIRQPVIGIDATLANFPASLGLSLSRMKNAFKTLEYAHTASETARPRCILDQLVIEWILPYLSQNLDPDVRKVLLMAFEKVWGQYQADIEREPSGRGTKVASLLDKLEVHDLQTLTGDARAWALRIWPNEFKVLQT